MLPAANVPPPYALASISALQFDHCGHRFATAALDGTVCTWQLEVGGRSNIRPTESSLCFDSHAAYVLFIHKVRAIILFFFAFKMVDRENGTTIFHYLVCFLLLAKNSQLI